MPEPVSTTAEILQINDTWLPKIREYNVTLEDIDTDNSKRDEAGNMHREILRPNVYHASIVHMATETEMIEICEAVKGDLIISVNALCPGKGSPYAEFDAYVSKLDTQLVLYQNQAGNTESWWQISYQLVEV